MDPSALRSLGRVLLGGKGAVVSGPGDDEASVNRP